MKYTRLDNIGLPTYKDDGTLSTVLAPGNNYPANEMGISKSEFVRTEEKNIILSGIYEENEVKYPLIDPVQYGVTPVPNTTFRFLIKDIGSTNLYASEELYNDLISAYEEKNPWFNVTSIPTINLDITFLALYHKVNKFTITQLYTEVEITSTLDREEEILQYIDWLVRPSVDIANINLKPTSELGTWAIKEDGQIGLGYKNIYESMNRDKDPDPEAIGDMPLNETYDLSLPKVTEVSSNLQPLPEEEIIPKIVDILITQRKPASEKFYSPFGEGLGSAILTAAAAAVAIIAVVGTGGLATPLIVAAGATLTAKGIDAISNSLTNKAGGSYVEFILARTTTRKTNWIGIPEPIENVFNRERDADEKDWNSVLSIIKGKMGTTRVTAAHTKAALAIVLGAFGNTKPAQLSYTMNAGWFGGKDRTYTINVVSADKITLTKS